MVRYTRQPARDAEGELVAELMEVRGRIGLPHDPKQPQLAFPRRPRADPLETQPPDVTDAHHSAAFPPFSTTTTFSTDAVWSCVNGEPRTTCSSRLVATGWSITGSLPLVMLSQK